MTHERCVQFNRFMIEVMGTHTHTQHSLSFIFRSILGSRGRLRCQRHHPKSSIGSLDRVQTRKKNCCQAFSSGIQLKIVGCVCFSIGWLYIYFPVCLFVSLSVCVCRQVCCYCGLFPCHLRSTLTQRLATFKQRANIMRCWKKKKSKKNSAGNVEKIDTQSGGIQSSISR
jgi:hypothetical protein